MGVISSFVNTSLLVHHALHSSTWTNQLKIVPLQREITLPSNCCSRSIEDTETEAEKSKPPPHNISTYDGGGTCTGILNSDCAIALLPLFAEITIESSSWFLVLERHLQSLYGALWNVLEYSPTLHNGKFEQLHFSEAL
uniref:Uncharacterized protein n=1 Tax=Nelumbo nucifera TaxID=4432 RepID=A0A822ZAC6_NELNU|nr:TPA_asm: hypothetical protein HUJ06_014309 [Nelumbo nucifera]